MRKLTTLLWLCLLLPALSAQTDFRKGYIVKLNGDTLSGYINYQKENLHYTSCNFKRFEIAVTVTYAPGMIKAYGIYGEKQYVSIIFQKKPVFAEYLVKGKVSLLYLNKGSVHFFTLTGNQPPVELKRGYREELTALFSPVDLTKEVNETRLSIASLTSLVKQYNELAGASFAVPVRPKEKRLMSDYSLLGSNKVKFGPLGGIYSLFFTPATFEGLYGFMKEADFKPVFVPVSGLFVKGNFSARSGIGYQADISYSNVSIYGFSKEKVFINSTTVAFNDIFIDYKNVEGRFNLNYQFRKDPVFFEPYLGVALHHRFNTGYRLYRQEYKEETHIVKSYEYSNIKLRTNEVAFSAGINTIWKLTSARWLIFDLGYEFGNKIIETKRTNDYEKVALKGGSSCFRLTVGLTL